jgi:hypothetical protein
MAADNSVLIAQLEQEIQDLIKQIIALLQQQMQAKISVANPAQTQLGSKTATLTVNVAGTSAYVSINNGAQFVYVSPITLNNGDTYSVIASSANGGGSSNSKCSGTASFGGSYVCNISMGGY